MRKTKRRFWYLFCQRVLQTIFVSYFRLRVFSKEKVPLQEGLLFVCNHQSYLDPILCTVGIEREFHYLARDSLFRNTFFSWLIRSLNAFPLGKERGLEAAQVSGYRLLIEGKAFVIFPEGTRTRTGQLQRFRHGAAHFAKNARVPVVPVYIDGAFQACPRGIPFPRPQIIHVYYGDPIYPKDYEHLSIQETTQLFFNQVQALTLRPQKIPYGFSNAKET